MSCCDCICLTATSTAAAPPQLCTAIQEYTRQTATALKTTTLSSACACRHRAAWTARPLAHGALRQHGMRQVAREQGQGVRLACPAGGGRLYGMPDWKLVHTLHAAAAWPTLSFLEFWDVLGSSFISSSISCVNYTGHGHGRATLTKGVGVSQWTHAAGCIP